MSGVRHDRSVAEAFLNGETRQVWAVDNRTGEPVFLPDGRAVEFHAEAKEFWSCPVPGCDVRITTVGGDSQRHHFRHDEPAPHSSDGESESHLAAKAMIAAWAQRLRPEGASVQEERSTEKDLATSRYRIADVMVTWASGEQTAFEVEYKNYAPDDWALKQSDYDTHQPEPIACVWLLGHLRLKEPPKNSYLHEVTGDVLVRIPLLARRWLAKGRPVLVINPMTRQIGTVVSRYDDLGPKHPAPDDDYGHLMVDLIDDCGLDPVLGIVTPAMKAIAAADERRRIQTEQRQENDRRDREARDQALNYYADLARKQEQAWNQSALAGVILKRWTQVPSLLDVGLKESKDQSGVWAHPTHWRAVIFEELLHRARPDFDPTAPSAARTPQRNNPRFTYADIKTALAAHGIYTHKRDPSKTYRTVLAFLERLENFKLVTLHRDANRRLLSCEPTGYPLEAAEIDRQHRIEQNRLIRQQKKQTQASRGTGGGSNGGGRGTRPERPAPAPRLPPATRVTRPVDKSKCERCHHPLPSWQSGGYHTSGCDAVNPDDHPGSEATLF